MWATITTLSFPQHPLPPESLSSLTNTFRINRRHRQLAVSAASSQDLGGLGQVVLSSGPSTSNNPGWNPSQKLKPTGGKQEKEKEISGSDILWALQRASAKKAKISSNKKQQKKKKGLDLDDSLNSKRGKKVVDYGKVRPISVKSDWATRLDDLEKRLQEFSSI